MEGAGEGVGGGGGFTPNTNPFVKGLQLKPVCPIHRVTPLYFTHTLQKFPQTSNLGLSLGFLLGERSS